MPSKIVREFTLKSGRTIEVRRFDTLEEADEFMRSNIEKDYQLVIRRGEGRNEQWYSSSYERYANIAEWTEIGLPPDYPPSQQAVLEILPITLIEVKYEK